MKKLNRRKRSHNATENQIQSYYEAKELGIIKNQDH